MAAINRPRSSNIETSRRVATISPERKPYTPPAWPEPPRTLAPLKRDDEDDGPALHCPHYGGMGVVNQ